MLAMLMLIISGLKTITDKYRAKFYNQNSDKKNQVQQFKF